MLTKLKIRKRGCTWALLEGGKRRSPRSRNGCRQGGMKGTCTMNENNRDEWDVITATNDGGVILRRYGDRKILVVMKGQTIEQALENEALEDEAREKRRE
jgi:hypothetical protein